MSGKGNIEGVRVSKEEVIAALGKPSAEWERNSRRREFEGRLVRGRTELDIAGIRGHGGSPGYLAYLEQSLVKPLGVGTSLVSEAENAAIMAELKPEIEDEIGRQRARLNELEKSPEAVADFVARMQWWLENFGSVEPGNPEDEEIEEMRLLTRLANDKHEKEVSTLKGEITAYTKLLSDLRSSASVSPPSSHEEGKQYAS